MLLYTCDGVEFGDVNEQMLTGGLCFATQRGEMNSPWLPCLSGNLIGAWAVGGGVSTILVFSIILSYIHLNLDISCECLWSEYNIHHPYKITFFSVTALFMMMD